MSMNVEVGRVPEWTIADRLRKARESAGYEQREFAQRTSMARATISAAENGHRVPSRANLKLWALATGVPFSWLTDGETPPTGDGVPTDGVVPPTGIEPATYGTNVRRLDDYRAVREPAPIPDQMPLSA